MLALGGEQTTEAHGALAMPARPIENIGASFVSGEKKRNHNEQHAPDMR
jgi:hypothetical protein